MGSLESYDPIDLELPQRSLKNPDHFELVRSSNRRIIGSKLGFWQPYMVHILINMIPPILNLGFKKLPFDWSSILLPAALMYLASCGPFPLYLTQNGCFCGSFILFLIGGVLFLGRGERNVVLWPPRPTRRVLLFNNLRRVLFVSDMMINIFELNNR